MDNTTTGKRKAEDPAEPIGIIPPPLPPNHHQPPYAPQYGVVGVANDAVAAPSPKKTSTTTTKKKARPTDSDKIQARLEANRKAAKESRRRKKVLVEELQRSVRFLCVCLNFLDVVVHVCVYGDRWTVLLVWSRPIPFVVHN